MDPNTNNILQVGLNAENYLSLCYGNQQERKEPQLQEIQDDYDDYYTSKLETQILLQESQLIFKAHSSTLGSEVSSSYLKKIGKEATAKYREKKKKYVQGLEDQVKKLEKEIYGVQTEIKAVKDSILTKLQSQIKAVHSTENAQIFNQLENCLNKNQEDQAMIDLDKVNLLLNTLKYRIGPSGRERQAKIEYNFKNIVNTWFPGLHRYFLVVANQKLDIFKTQDHAYLPWTKELLEKMNLSEEQVQKIKQEEEKLTKMYASTLQKIRILQKIKQKMREQALQLDSVENQIREHINPVQCARWTTFCEKYKYRKDISLDGKFRPRTASGGLQQEMAELLQFKLGRKMVRVERN